MQIDQFLTILHGARWHEWASGYSIRETARFIALYDRAADYVSLQKNLSVGPVRPWVLYICLLLGGLDVVRSRVIWAHYSVRFPHIKNRLVREKGARFS